MSQESSVVCLYPSIDAAEEAVQKLGQSGFPIQQVSIITKDLGSEKKVHGFVTSCDVAKSVARTGAWVGGIFGLLVGAAVIWVPGVGRAHRGRLARHCPDGRPSKGQSPAAALRHAGLADVAGNLEAAHPQVRGKRQGRQVHGGGARHRGRGREGPCHLGCHQPGGRSTSTVSPRPDARAPECFP